MKFTIEKTQLLNSLTAVAKGMSSRTTMPILSGILFIVSDGKLTLRTTDLEISIQHTVTALVEEEGETVIPGKLLTDIIKSLSDSAVTFETSLEGVTVSSEKSIFSLHTLNALDYPSFPVVVPEKSMKLEGKTLQEMVKRVYKAVSRDESRAVLMGILLKAESEKISLAATDSYRLAVVEKKMNVESNFELIIPGAVLDEVARLSNGEIVIGEAENQISFNFGETIFVSRKIEGSYPNYESLIPQNKEMTAVINTKELSEAIRRVSIAGQNHSPIKLEFNVLNQQIRVSSSTKDIASADETISAQIEGADLEIGFNHQYIADGISVVDEEEVSFEGQSSLKPGVIKTNKEIEFLYLAMPVRIDA